MVSKKVPPIPSPRPASSDYAGSERDQSHDASSKRASWDDYRARHGDALLASGLARAGGLVEFWADAMKEHSSAVVGWGQEIIQQRDYPINRLVPDMLTFSAGAMNTATEWVRLVTTGNPKGKG